MIKVEANLLRLPLFALHTRGLASIDGIECRGKTQRNGVAQEYYLASTRNAATHYPGPLARSIHMAFLSLAADRGFPLANPVTWTWRDLCRRMGITYSGRTVTQLKGAILSTRGLMIRSHYALYAKQEGKLLHTNERALSLYDEVRFTSDAASGDEVVDANGVWFSAWYLENLNTFFTAPLDYTLWRDLDARSTIASRLYEFLLLNLYGDAPLFRINYKNLAQLLPVRAEKYASDARKQLGPALQHLRDAGVVERVVWAEGRDGGEQLQFFRGPRLGAPKPVERPAADLPEELVGSIEVSEVRNARPAEWSVVADFYREWSGLEHPRPAAGELQQARDLVQQFGLTKTRALLDLAMKRMRAEWPQAKTFTAVTRYLGDASREFERAQSRAEAQRREQAEKEARRTQRDTQEADWERFAAVWRPAWEAADPAEREAIRSTLLARRPFLARSPRMLESMCLEELSQRRGATPPAVCPGDPG